MTMTEHGTAARRTHNMAHATAVYARAETEVNFDNVHQGITDKTDEEIQGILGYLINNVTDDTLSTLTKPNIDWGNNKSPFSPMRDLCRSQLLGTWRSIYRSISEGLNGDDDSLTRVYGRLIQICPDGAEKVKKGIYSAVYVMSKVVEAAPTLEPNASPQRHIEVAKASYPFVAKIAMNRDGNFNQAIFLLTGQHLLEPGFDEEVPFKTSKLTITGSRIDFSNATEETLKRFARNGDRPGCPAMWNPGDGSGSAIRKLYDWFVSQATDIYIDQEFISSRYPLN